MDQKDKMFHEVMNASSAAYMATIQTMLGPKVAVACIVYDTETSMCAVLANVQGHEQVLELVDAGRKSVENGKRTGVTGSGKEVPAVPVEGAVPAPTTDTVH